MRFLNIRQLKSKIKRDPRGFFSKCPPTMRALLDLLFSWDNHQESFTAFIEYIADRLGCTERYVFILLRQLKDWGIVQSQYRGHDGLPCVFVINPWFHKIGIRRELSSIFETFNNYANRYLFSLCLFTPITNPSVDCISNLKSESVYITHAPARQLGSGSALDIAPQATLLSKKEIKQRKTVISEPRLHAIMEINKIFPLSAHGIVKLSVFSAAALHYAYKQSDMALTKYDPFGYFANLCSGYDAKTGSKPDWEGYHLRREALGISKEDICFMDQERLAEVLSTQESITPTQPVASAVKKTPKRVGRESWAMIHTDEQIKSMPVPGATSDGKAAHNSQAMFANLIAFPGS